MDRSTTYMILALIVLLGIGALIYANTASQPTAVPTSATGSGTGTTGTSPTTSPATKP